MSMAALRAIRPMKLPATQKLVLWALADQANDAGEAWPSIAGLVEATCLSERAVQGALLGLRAAGVVVAEVGGGRHRTTLYRLTLKLETPQDVHQTPQHMQGNSTQETPHILHKTPQELRETPQDVRETPQEMHPNPQEPSRTLIEPNKRRTRANPEPDALPDWLPADAWADWRSHRRKGWTPNVATLCIRNIGKLRDEGHDPRAVIEQSIANGWTGLFPIKSQGALRQAPPTQGRRAAGWQRFVNGDQPAAPPAFDLDLTADGVTL